MLWIPDSIHSPATVFKNYSSCPNCLLVNSPWGRRPNGLLTQRSWDIVIIQMQLKACFQATLCRYVRFFTLPSWFFLISCTYVLYYNNNNLLIMNGTLTLTKRQIFIYHIWEKTKLTCFCFCLCICFWREGCFFNCLWFPLYSASLPNSLKCI